MNTCTYPFTPENIEAAHRRASRIHAMRNGEEIPNPETAVSDARPGSFDDAAVIAVLTGQKIRASFSPPAQPVESGAEFANSAADGFWAIGPNVKCDYRKPDQHHPEE